MSIHSLPGTTEHPVPPLSPPAYPLVGIDPLLPPTKSLIADLERRGVGGGGGPGAGGSEVDKRQAFHQVLMMKGAPDVVLLKCTHYLDLEGRKQRLDSGFLEEVNAAYTEYASQVRLWGGENEIHFVVMHGKMDNTMYTYDCH